VRRLLVLGGTGFLGRTLCEQLIETSGGAARIVVPSRRPAKARTLWMLPGVELVHADVHDEATLVRLLHGKDAVVNLVAILHGSQEQFREVHVELPRKLARACRTAGVRRVVHVSALGAAQGAPSHYQRSKAAGEMVLREAGLDLTVLRPSVMFGADDRFMNTFASLQAHFPFVPLASPGARFQPVWVADVAQAIVRALARRETIGLTMECAGPTVYTLSQLVRLAGRWSGHERAQIALPDALARLQARLMELLPGEPLLSRDNLDAMRVPNIANGTPGGLATLGIRPRALEAVMPELLARGGEPARLDGWRKAARRV
jgi:uncharacterized protein YbjT (DUF2867 family)